MPTTTEKITIREAVLTAQLEALSQQVSKIDVKLDAQNKHFDVRFSEISHNYISQQQYSDLRNQLEDKIGALDRDLSLFKKSVRVNYILVAIISALFTALIYAQIGGKHLL